VFLLIKVKVVNVGEKILSVLPEYLIPNKKKAPVQTSAFFLK
jgi:hypothetical protein